MKLHKGRNGALHGRLIGGNLEWMRIKVYSIWSAILTDFIVTSRPCTNSILTKQDFPGLIAKIRTIPYSHLSVGDAMGNLWSRLLISRLCRAIGIVSDYPLIVPIKKYLTAILNI